MANKSEKKHDLAFGLETEIMDVDSGILSANDKIVYVAFRRITAPKCKDVDAREISKLLGLELEVVTKSIQRLHALGFLKAKTITITLVEGI